jgi:hypothetical protein
VNLYWEEENPMKTNKRKHVCQIQPACITKPTKVNEKRSRFMKKTNEELLFEILVRAEQVGSFCPEKLMGNGRNRIFEEAYRCFETWDKIVERCIIFSNHRNLIGKILKTPKEVILEILRLETNYQSLRESDIPPDLHTAAVLFYGSWNRALAIVGLKCCDRGHDSAG